MATPAVASARPAEALTIVGAVAFLIARALGVENDTTMTALTMVIAFTPAAVTWLVELFNRKETEPAEVPADAVAQQLSKLNATLEAATAARPSGDHNGGGLQENQIRELIEATIKAREEKRDTKDAISDLLETVREATEIFAKAKASLA